MPINPAARKSLLWLRALLPNSELICHGPTSDTTGFGDLLLATIAFRDQLESVK